MFFSEEQEIESEVHTSLAKRKSSYNALRNRNVCLDKTVDFLQQQLLKTFDKYKSISVKLSGKI